MCGRSSRGCCRRRSREARMERPLQGLRVLEASGGVAVRYCGRMFAQLGAEVTTLIPSFGDNRLGYAGRAGEGYGRWLDAGKQRAEAPPEGGADLVIAGQDRSAIAAAELL